MKVNIQPTLEGLVTYLHDEGQKWHMYAASTEEPKMLQVQIGGSAFRVLHGREIVYEGYNGSDAIAAFNKISGPPTNVPKTTN